MSHRILLFALLLFACLTPVHATAPAPDDARLDRLLEVTRAQSLLEATLPQIEAAQRQMVAQLTGDQSLDAARQARLDAILERAFVTVRQVLAWENMEPVYRDIYRRTFSAEDVDAIIAFYETPTGQRMLDRMPALMQHSMEAMQHLIVPVLEQMQQDIGAEMSGAG